MRLKPLATLPLALLLAAAPPATAPSVRVAAIGGINDLDFWPELAKRFEQSTGTHIDTVATGNKDDAPALFRKGNIDLLTLQSPDAILNLVATGHATNPQPWLLYDLLLIGPKSDPAGVKGMTDAAAAIKKIVAAKSELVIHANAGADQIIRAILLADKGNPDPAHTTVLLDDHQKRVLQIADDKKAYTLIARIPFLSGKITAPNLDVMVAHDPLLRRPYTLATSKTPTPEATRLAAFLTSDDTQQWIATYGKGKVDDHPLYFPVAHPTTDVTH